MAQRVLSGAHLRAGAPSYLRPADLFAGPSYFHRHLRQWPPVSGLECGLPPVLTQSLEAARLIRCGAGPSAATAALAGGTGLCGSRRHHSEEDRTPYSRREDPARSHVAALPRESLL